MAQLNTTAAASPEDHKVDRLYRQWQSWIFSPDWLGFAGYYFCRKPLCVVKAGLPRVSSVVLPPAAGE